MEYKGHFGKCVFIDCIKGMKKIPDNYFDLGITDPPWGVNVDGKKKRGISKKKYPTKRHDERINYNDKFDHEFNLKWFKEFQRITRVQIICFGRKQEYYWIRNFDPIGTIIVIIKNPYGSSMISKFSSYSPYFVHGNLKKNDKFYKNVFFLTMQCGFLNKKEKHKYIHPNPKTYVLWKDIIKNFFKNQYKGKKIIDIFGGTCVLGEVCESLGLKWLTFEIEELYLPDIKYRIINGIRRFDYKFKEKKKSKIIKLDEFI